MIDATRLFTPAFRDYCKESTLKVNKSLLENYYEQEFGEQYRVMNNGLVANTSDLDRDSVALQHAYIAANKHPLGNKDALDAAHDGSTYSQLHQKFHPHICDYLNKFGYYNRVSSSRLRFRTNLGCFVTVCMKVAVAGGGANLA